MGQKEPRIYRSESWLARWGRFQAPDGWPVSKCLPPWCHGAVGWAAHVLILPLLSPLHTFSLLLPPHVFCRLQRLRTQKEDSPSLMTENSDSTLVEDTVCLQHTVSLPVRCKSCPWALNSSLTHICQGMSLFSWKLFLLLRVGMEIREWCEA